MDFFHRFVLVAAVMFLIMVSCGPRDAHAIYNCTSPKDVYEEAMVNGWPLVSSRREFETVIEVYLVNERKYMVWFTSSWAYRGLCLRGQRYVDDKPTFKGAVDEGQ